MNHPQWVIKFVHKSKVNAVKIVEWENHHEVATIRYVYTHNGEESDGAKNARLISSAPELLESIRTVYSRVMNTNINTPIGEMQDTWEILREVLDQTS